MSSRRRILVPLAAALALGSAFTGGCSQRQQILMNPTPELATLSQREDDLANNFSYSANQNFRMLRRDWEVLWLRSDRPSSLSFYPIR